MSKMIPHVRMGHGTSRIANPSPAPLSLHVAKQTSTGHVRLESDQGPSTLVLLH
jgi:hypothetical protein